MDVADVKIIFKNPWSLEIFTRIVSSLQVDPKIVYQWIYQHILGNCVQKDKDFQHVVMYNFGHQRLVDLINLDKMGRVTLANCKQVMQLIVDGDTRMPSEIAET